MLNTAIYPFSPVICSCDGTLTFKRVEEFEFEIVKVELFVAGVKVIAEGETV